MKKIFLPVVVLTALASNVIAQIKVVPGGNVVLSRPLDPSTFVLIGETANKYPLYYPGKLSINSYYQPSIIVDHNENLALFDRRYHWPIVSNSNSRMMYAKHWATSINKYSQTSMVTSQGYHFAHGYSNISDSNFKYNIENIQDALGKILLLRGVTYKFKPSTYCGDSCTPADVNAIDSLPRHFGFISQEVEPIFPELVSDIKRPFDTKALNYIEIIPLLLEGIKEQQQQIAALQWQLQLCCQSGMGAFYNGEGIIAWPGDTIVFDTTGGNLSQRRLNKKPDGDMDAAGGKVSLNLPVLYQNEPNPFNSSTTIRFDIPANYTKANLYIYTYQGEQIKSYKIDTKGTGSIQIKGSEYKPGIYLYSLIVDGKEISTKKMILTK